MNMKKLTLSLAVTSALSFSGSVFAADLGGTANVTVLTAVSVAETQTVEFGSIENQDGACTMSSAGNLSSAGGAVGSCTGAGTLGVMTISGSGTSAVAYSVAGGAAVGGVTFAPAVTGTSGNLVAGSLAVDVFGELTLATATAGAKALSYTFTANYQ